MYIYIYIYCKNTITNIYNYKPKHLYTIVYQNLHMYYVPSCANKIMSMTSRYISFSYYIFKKKTENERFVFTEPDTNTQWSLEDSKVLM